MDSVQVVWTGKKQQTKSENIKKQTQLLNQQNQDFYYVQLGLGVINKYD